MLPRRSKSAARPPRPSAAATMGGGASGASGVPPEMQPGLLPSSMLANPSIAQREALRQFYIAATPEAQLAAAQQAAALGDLGTRCGALLRGTPTGGLAPVAGTRCGSRGAGVRRRGARLGAHPASPSPVDA